MTKKILLFLFVLVFMFTLTTYSSATNIALNSINTTNDVNNLNTNDTNSSNNIETTFELVEDNSCIIDLDGMATFEKSMTDFDANERSITLTLTIRSLLEQGTVPVANDAEIFLVIDNSSSMIENYVGDTTRKQAVIDSANTLVQKLFEANPDFKIGVVGFSSLDSSKGETEGTINDATLRLGLSNSEEEVKNAITNLAELEEGPRTNIEAGLTIAQNNFSTDEGVNRYIVLLTDGVPNNATDGTSLTYSGVVATRAKAKIEEIQDSGIQILASMINLDSETVEPTTQKTYRELAEEIFGTEENPTTSKYFYVPDAELGDTIINDIYDNLVEEEPNTINNIVIKDYFPQEIVDNFNFEYVESANIGNASADIDKETNCITWNIETLNPGETASLSYKLTLKDNFDETIINQVLPTNEKVDITAEHNGETIENSSDDSPSVIIKQEKIEKPVVNEVDNTISNKPIPQTGDNSSIWFIATVSIIAIVLISRWIYLRNMSK